MANRMAAMGQTPPASKPQRLGGGIMSSRYAATGIGLCRRSRLPLAIVLALGGAESINAQDEPGAALEEVVVTGSRIRTSGMDMPNPVTVVTREEMDILAPTTMIEALAELPQFYGSNTTQNPGGFFTTTGAGTP